MVIGRTVCSASASSWRVFFLYEHTVCTADKQHHAMTRSSRREDSPHTGNSVHLFGNSLRFLSMDADESQTLLLLLCVCVQARECVCVRARA